MERKLASIRRIKDIQEIEGADKIELAIVDGWKVVVAKDVGHSIGDPVVYCEIDSFLPIKDDYEFLRKSSYKKLQDGTEGFRLKTIRLRGQVSQGLILPINILRPYDIEESLESSFKEYMLTQIGRDVTELLGITKYEPPIPAQLAGRVEGQFPSFIKKTDEERVQNIFEENFYNKYKDSEFYVTEKLDGTSFTCYFKDGKFGVCSRNLELKRDENNTLWKVAIENNLEEKLTKFDENIAIQGEVIGEGIQKNPYKLKGQHLYVFNIFNIDTFEYLDKINVGVLCKELNLNEVPFKSISQIQPNVDEMLKLAEFKSHLNNQTEAEGLVWVLDKNNNENEERVSFKTISNKFLLKQK